MKSIPVRQFTAFTPLPSHQPSSLLRQAHVDLKFVFFLKNFLIVNKVEILT